MTISKLLTSLRSVTTKETGVWRLSELPQQTGQVFEQCCSVDRTRGLDVDIVTFGCNGFFLGQSFGQIEGQPRREPVLVVLPFLS